MGHRNARMARKGNPTTRQTEKNTDYEQRRSPTEIDLEADQPSLVNKVKDRAQDRSGQTRYCKSPDERMHDECDNGNDGNIFSDTIPHRRIASCQSFAVTSASQSMNGFAAICHSSSGAAKGALGVQTK